MTTPSKWHPTFPPQLTSRTILADRPEARSIFPLHDHAAFVDEYGEGATDTTSGHFHRVREGVVMPDESDGHTHVLASVPAGAGFPTPVGLMRRG